MAILNRTYMGTSRASQPDRVATRITQRSGTGGDLTTSGSQTPPFLTSNRYVSGIHRSWLDQASNLDELLRVQRTISGIPEPWLVWADQQQRAREQRSGPLSAPLRYKEQTLQQGIIALQECKYICDLVENALRQNLSTQIQELGLHRSPYLIVSGHTRLSPPPLDSLEAIGRITFGELTETIGRYWKRYPSHPLGFRQAVWAVPACRQLQAFTRGMNTIRAMRNDIAHSRHPVSSDSTRRLYAESRIWLEALGVNLAEKLKQYRVHRPYFLRHLP
jgi:hypothetical protein